MALFKKNANEANYATGKKNWADVIKNTSFEEGYGRLLVWKQHEEDFNTNSTVIVNRGELAVFMKNGNIEEVLKPGDYKLSTENYPFISRLRNAFTGGVSTFNCFVFFFNTAISTELTWGTGDGPITFKDPEIGKVVQIRGNGTYNIQVKDPGVLIDKMVTSNILDFTPETIKTFLSGRMQEHIISTIHGVLEAKDTLVYNVISKLSDFSKAIKPQLNEIFDGFGLELENFAIKTLRPDEKTEAEYNKLIDETLWDIKRKTAEAEGDLARMEKLGDERWMKQQMMNNMKTMAENPGAAGGLMGAGMGMGMGAAAGGMFGQMMQPMMQQPMQQPMMQGQYQQQPMMQQPMQQAPAAEDPVAALKKLKDMLDMGLIEQAEFDSKKAEIMSRM
jgi:membrane protease subunit (stomatin/prohibitin family)